MKTKIMFVGVHLLFVAATGFMWMPVATAQGTGETSEGMNKKNGDRKAVSDGNVTNRNTTSTELGADAKEIVFIQKDFYREFNQRAMTTYGTTIAFERVTISDIKQLLYDSLNGNNKAYAELLKNKYDGTLERRISDIIEEKYDNSTSTRKLATDLITVLSQLKTDVQLMRINGPRVP